MKKEFEHIKNPAVTIEQVVYGVALVLAVFVTGNLMEKLGWFSMTVTAIITIATLVPVAFFLIPNFREEELPPAIVDQEKGCISVGNASVSAEDVKEIWVVRYTSGKQFWKAYRIKGKSNVSIDTRSFPEADKLETPLQKLFPNTKIKAVDAASPFRIISWAAFLYISIVAVLAAVI